MTEQSQEFEDKQISFGAVTNTLSVGFSTLEYHEIDALTKLPESTLLRII